MAFINEEGIIENIKELLLWFAKGKVKPHIHKTYSLKDAPLALEDIMSRKAKGKIVIDMTF